MDDESFDTSSCVIIRIEPPLSEQDEKEEVLNMYFENTSGGKSVTIKLNESRNLALVDIVGVENVSALEEKIKKGYRLQYKLILESVPSWNKIMVNGSVDLIDSLRDHPEESVLCLYFENQRMCPLGGEVSSISLLPCQHAAIVEFKDPFVVKRLPRKHTVPHLSADTLIETRPLDFFEYFDKPSCVVCDQLDVIREEDNVKECEEDDMETNKHNVKSCSSSDNEKSSNEDSVVHDQVASKTPSGSDSDYDELEDLMKWSGGDNLEHVASSSKKGTSINDKSFSADKNLFIPEISDRKSILYQTLKFKKMPGWNSELYERLKLHNNEIEIRGSDLEMIQTRKALEDACGFAEVDLAQFTRVADKLNSKEGRKWIESLLHDLKHPVQIKDGNGSVLLEAIDMKLAKEAAETIAQSLLPAKIRCKSSCQMERFSKTVRNEKKSIVIVEEDRKTGCLKLLGIPVHVIEAVRKIEKCL